MYQQPGYPQQPAFLVTPPTSGRATASMVFGIIGLVVGCCSFGIPSLLAIILGHMANSQINSQGLGGRGQATAGLVMGYIVIVPAIALSVWLIVMGGLGALFTTEAVPTVSVTPSLSQ